MDTDRIGTGSGTFTLLADAPVNLYLCSFPTFPSARGVLCLIIPNTCI